MERSTWTDDRLDQFSLAVSDDLRGLRDEIGGLRSDMREEMGGLRSEMREEMGGLRSEMGGLRSEIGALAAAIHEETSAGFRQVNADLSAWGRQSTQIALGLSVALVGILAAVAAAIVAAVL